MSDRSSSSTPGNDAPGRDRPPADYSDLRALFVNTTLKPSPQRSNTRGLMDVAATVMERQGVTVEFVRAVDHPIAPGVAPDMTEHGAAEDAWPELFERVTDAHILVIGTPIWLGEKSSVCRRVIERLYAESGETDDAGLPLFYGRVGGCIVTGNEDGYKHCARSILYALQHLGYTVPPHADAAWVGEAGPGPSYLDDDSGGPENEFTQRTTTFLAWNLMHVARMLEDAGGIPAYGNVAAAWQAGERFGHPADGGRDRN